MKRMFTTIFILLFYSSFSQILDNENRDYSFIELDEYPTTQECQNHSRQEKFDCFKQFLNDHVNKNFNYPEKAIKNKINGKVLITFTINKEGKVDSILTDGADEILQKEARRIISILPQFKPGIESGKPVNVKYSVPLTFKLPD